MEKGTDVFDILTGRNTTFPKNSIVICVKIRSQEEMESNMAMEQFEEDQKQF